MGCLEVPFDPMTVTPRVIQGNYKAPVSSGALSRIYRVPCLGRSETADQIGREILTIGNGEESKLMVVRKILPKGAIMSMYLISVSQ